MAEVMSRFAPSYLKSHTVSGGQQRLIRDIQQCRTSALGDHWTACTSCGDIKVHYNSCGNRFCPNCQGVKKRSGLWNFGTGALGDMGCHLVDSPFRVLQLGHPTEVECSVGQVFTRDWIPEYIPEGCPPSSTIQLKFPATAKKTTPKLSSTGPMGVFAPFTLNSSRLMTGWANRAVAMG